jgi:hypothetical protein
MFKLDLRDYLLERGEEMWPLKSIQRRESMEKEVTHMRVPLRVNRLLEKTVVNENNEKLGDVKDMILGPEGHVRYILVGLGGTLGIGEKLVPVPWEALTITHDGENMVFSLDMGRDKFDQAPHFLNKEWASFASTDWEENVRRYYKGNGSTSAGEPQHALNPDDLRDIPD